MFHIKICGVTNPGDARLAVEAGADAIGVNFYAGSFRCVTEAAARAVVDSLPQGIARVGVFVNMPASGIAELADRLRLDYVQLHGDEAPEVVAQLAPRRVVRAFRVAAGHAPSCEAYLASCKKLGHMPAAILIDAAVPGEYGGTGVQADWDQLSPPRAWLAELPLILAGGLAPENVSDAIARVRPSAVDTASGVETSPGCKDAHRMRRFVDAARGALELCRTA